VTPIEYATMLVVCACMAYVAWYVLSLVPRPSVTVERSEPDPAPVEPADGWDEALLALIEWERIAA
jgi:hypothetical protein